MCLTYVFYWNCKDNLFISNLLVLKTKLLILCFILLFLHPNRIQWI